jgi:hypothetical protein
MLSRPPDIDAGKPGSIVAYDPAKPQPACGDVVQIPLSQTLLSGLTGRPAFPFLNRRPFGKAIFCRSMFLCSVGAPFLCPGLHIQSATRGAAVKTGRRPPPQAAHCGLDGCEHGATLDQAGSPFVLPGHGSFRGLLTAATWHRKRPAPLCPERGHRKRAARESARLPGLVPAGTGSRLDQADLDWPMKWPDMIMRRPGRRPSRSRSRPSRRDA